MELLGTVDWSGRIFSGGWVAGGGETYSAVEPATGQILGQVGAASAADLDRAVGLAQQAQPLWAEMSYQARAASASPRRRSAGSASRRNRGLVDA
jgi:benzaldehyde dehydrogenase (NAD)